MDLDPSFIFSLNEHFLAIKDSSLNLYESYKKQREAIIQRDPTYMFRCAYEMEVHLIYRMKQIFIEDCPVALKTKQRKEILIKKLKILCQIAKDSPSSELVSYSIQKDKIVFKYSKQERLLPPSFTRKGK